MKFAYTVLAAWGGLVSAVPQDAAAAGCSESYGGPFEVTVAPAANQKREVRQYAKRADCGGDGILVMTLSAGTLTDSRGRTGYIASNYQFQFDAPPQAGALAAGGFALCGGALALAGSTTFYRCLSGTFYNLYTQDWAPQCEPVHILPVPCAAAAGTPTGTPLVPTTLVTVLSDGQPQVVSTDVPLCQIGDGQVQGQTGPCASAPPPVPTSSPSPEVCQIGDGQVQGQTGPCASPSPSPAPGPAPAPAPAAGGQPQLCEIWGDGHIRAPPPAGAQYQGSWGHSDQGFGGGSPGGWA